MTGSFREATWLLESGRSIGASVCMEHTNGKIKCATRPHGPTKCEDLRPGGKKRREKMDRV
uniref:Uncharacterized protein n=1 Tax=Peronospora matthiolae TaxID=2874970 RepID=A0AAV1V609_9STRA